MSNPTFTSLALSLQCTHVLARGMRLSGLASHSTVTTPLQNTLHIHPHCRPHTPLQDARSILDSGWMPVVSTQQGSHQYPPPPTHPPTAPCRRRAASWNLAGCRWSTPAWPTRWWSSAPSSACCDRCACWGGMECCDVARVARHVCNVCFSVGHVCNVCCCYVLPVRFTPVACLDRHS